MIQLRNLSSTKAFTINWSNGDSTPLAASGVGDVPEAISEAEVDLKLGGLKYVEKLCGQQVSDADLDIQYKVTEGNDAVFTLSPSTVSLEVANTANAHTREIVIEVATAAGERITSFDGNLTLTLSTDSSEGSVEFDFSNPDLVVGNSPEVATLFVRDGYGKVGIICSGLWASSETNTLTLSQQSYRGITLAQKTSVETISIA